MSSLSDFGVECFHGGNCRAGKGLTCVNCGRPIRDVLESQANGVMSIYDAAVLDRRNGRRSVLDNQLVDQCVVVRSDR